jgi:hypothetical protein
MQTEGAELNERQLTLDLVGPQICMYRRYANHLAPYSTHKNVTSEKLGFIRGRLTVYRERERVVDTSKRASRMGSLLSRWRAGGFEINLFPAHKHGFETALKLLETRPVVEAYMGKLEAHIPDPYDLEMWVFAQLELKAFKRIK